MKPANLALASLASLTLLAFPLHAADRDAKSGAPGFNELDKDNDGQLTRGEAAGNASLVKRFSEADSDKDGRLSRGEYLATMGAKDLRGVRERLADAIEPGDQSKEKPQERGFNELDRDGDGKLSRTEAARNPNVAKKFSATDADNDGYLTRTEYLKTAVASDWHDFRDWAADAVRPEDKGQASAGGSSK